MCSYLCFMYSQLSALTVWCFVLRPRILYLVYCMKLMLQLIKIKTLNANSTFLIWTFDFRNNIWHRLCTFMWICGASSSHAPSFWIFSNLTVCAMIVSWLYRCQCTVRFLGMVLFVPRFKVLIDDPPINSADFSLSIYCFHQVQHFG